MALKRIVFEAKFNPEFSTDTQTIVAESEGAARRQLSNRSRQNLISFTASGQQKETQVRTAGAKRTEREIVPITGDIRDVRPLEVLQRDDRTPEEIRAEEKPDRQEQTTKTFALSDNSPEAIRARRFGQAPTHVPFDNSPEAIRARRFGTPPPGAPDTRAEIATIDEEANKNQQDEFDILDKEPGEVDVSKSTKVVSDILGKLEEAKSPEPPDLRETFEEERARLGVGEIEDELALVDEEIAQIEADFASNIETQEGRQVAKGSIDRRLSKAGIDTNRALRDLQVKRNTIVNELNNKNAVIGQIMQFTQQDFANASAQYKTDFTNTINTMNLIRGIENDEKDEQERAIDNARANAQILYNGITAGNIDVDDLTATQRLQLNKLETEAGLPVGTYQTLANQQPGAKILSQGTSTDAEGNQFVWIMTEGEDGTPQIVNVGDTGGFKKPSTTKPTPEEEDEARSTEFVAAEAFVKENSDMSDEQLTAAISRDSTDLSSSDIKTIVAARSEKPGLTDSKVNNAAVQLVFTGDNASFEKKAGDFKPEELRKAKELAKNRIETASSISGVDLTDKDKQAIKDAIDALTVDDIDKFFVK